MADFLKKSFTLAVLIFAAVNYCLAQTPPIFNVKDFGATGNGITLDSPAVNAAIAAAGAAGGGSVTFPAGNYLCGSIHLTNNLTLYLSNNAVILASATNIDTHEANVFSQYQDQGHSYFHDSLIWGENLTNLTFAGPGEINGNGGLTTGNPSVANPGDKALCLVLCNNVIINGITITKGGHFGILAQACTNMLVSGAQILESTSRDGFNLIDSSDVVITNCVIQGSDDSMCLKSTYALGRKIGAHNIHIVNCQILSTENNALQFGSETVGDFHDVTWANIQIGGAGKAGIGITSQDGSVIDGVTYNNITMSNCACPIFLKLDHRTTDSPNPAIGRIQNISINNVTAVHSTLFNRTNTSTINGYLDTNSLAVIPIENITFNNVNVSNIGQNPASAVTNYPVEIQDWQPQNFGKWPSYGWYLRWAKNISFTNCQVHFDYNDDRPAVVADTVTNVLFDNFSADVGQNNTNYDMSFLNIPDYEANNVFATTNAPVPGTALRINSSNATPALIVSPPYFNPGDGIYTTTQTVTIASGIPGATIRYTTDGTTPTPTDGTIYSAPVTISSETVLHAVAYADGLTNSAVNTAIYNFLGTSLSLPPPPPPSPVTNFLFEAESIPFITNGATALVQTDVNSSNGKWEALQATANGSYIEYTFDHVPAGKYQLDLKYKGNTSNRGIITHQVDGVPLGDSLDQYSSAQTYPELSLGVFTFTNNGSHTVRQTVIGKNPAGTGSRWAAADKFTLALIQPLQPTFNGILYTNIGSIQLGGAGFPTLPYRVQINTNLSTTNWITIGTATADASGALFFTDTNAANQPAAFYRFVTP